ncbi:V-set and immunoglobulin domain-containing protein 1-like [Paramormyrops kingsleyae]|uniref:V-set and immunoglobulin domain-containing protein 1 n=1 Tax=Paramormyrops kingsleyae TaxID=1676925 RepID=A0A3B3S5P3_9TELE|nr:V-set and immunoglobulin domain-containing protein 1-like [Paramormyrops kingsleyae]
MVKKKKTAVARTRDRNWPVDSTTETWELIVRRNHSKMWPSVMSLAVLSSLYGSVHSITVSVPDKFVNETSGASVLLGCSFLTSAPTTGLNIQWSFISKNTMTSKQIYYYQGGEEIVYPDYKGRVIVPPSPITTNASISIQGVTPADSGVYFCDVHNVPDVQGTTQGTITLNVLEKPSKPFCGLHGTVESGHLVTLTCHSEHGSPAPTYKWTKLEQGQAVSTRAVTNLQTGVLHFGNLSQFEFGQYKCNASNSVGFATCTITLDEERSDGTIAGAVVGSVLVACLIVFVVWCVVHSLRKKKHKASIEMESKARNASPANSYIAVPPVESNSQASTKEISSQMKEEEPVA